MAKDAIKVADLDLNALRAEIKKVTPKMISYQEALDKVRDPLLEKRSEGATVEDLASALGRQGIKVSARSLKTYLDSGKFPTKSAAQPKASATTKGFTADTPRLDEADIS